MVFKFSDISIKWQLLIPIIILVSIPIIILGLVSYNTIKTEAYSNMEDVVVEDAHLTYSMIGSIFDIAQKKVNSDLTVARTVLTGYGSASLDPSDTIVFDATDQITKSMSRITIPRMKFSDGTTTTEVYDNHLVVDHIQEMVGGTATIFQVIPNGLLRISTNVLKTDGTRAIGTYIPTDSPVYQTVMRGETYRGRAFVVNAWYLTAYEPIKDASGAIIGVLYVGVPEDDYKDELLEEVAKIVVGETGYIWIIDDEGNYVLSLNRQRDGENIWEAKDAEGNLFIQEMILGGKELPKDGVDIKYYPWQNNGEMSAKMKIAAFTRFDDWGWTIGPSAYVNDFTKSLSKVRNMTILICLISIILGILVAYYFAFMISGALKKILKGLAEMEMGNLTQDMTVKTQMPELRMLSLSIDGTRKRIASLLSNVIGTTNTAASNAEQLSASAEEVNASVQQVSATVQEISKSAQELSKNASDALTKSKMTETSSANGSKAAQEVMTKMETITGTTKEGADKVKALGAKSEKIGNIVETINGISEQTNLLALNAAIEAARAGDAGRGFAVVADEVRKLAEESQKATAQISALIGEIQQEIGGAVKSMDANTTQVDEGVKAVRASLAAFEEIPILVGQVNKTIAQISAISEENAAGAEEVSASVEEVTSAMQQVAGAAQQLSKGANDLKTQVGHFRVSGGKDA